MKKKKEENKKKEQKGVVSEKGKKYIDYHESTNDVHYLLHTKQK